MPRLVQIETWFFWIIHCTSEYTESAAEREGGGGRGGGTPRIDPKFVNNPELSDIQFRVEGNSFHCQFFFINVLFAA